MAGYMQILLQQQIPSVLRAAAHLVPLPAHLRP